MKKQDLNLKSLAILGLATGILISAQGVADDTSKKVSSKQEEAVNKKNDKKAKASDKDDFDKAFEKYDGNITYHPFTEEELVRELTPEGKKMFQSLSPEGKELALKVASQTCNGQNECKGFNGCETAEHKCAGKGECKGTGKCAISDKNLAVKLVYDKMKDKRQKAAN